MHPLLVIIGNKFNKRFFLRVFIFDWNLIFVQQVFNSDFFRMDNSFVYTSFISIFFPMTFPWTVFTILAIHCITFLFHITVYSTRVMPCKVASIAVSDTVINIFGLFYLNVCCCFIMFAQSNIFQFTKFSIILNTSISLRDLLIEIRDMSISIWGLRICTVLLRNFSRSCRFYLVFVFKLIDSVSRRASKNFFKYLYPNSQKNLESFA